MNSLSCGLSVINQEKVNNASDVAEHGVLYMASLADGLANMGFEKEEIDRALKVLESVRKMISA